MWEITAFIQIHGTVPLYRSETRPREQVSMVGSTKALLFKHWPLYLQMMHPETFGHLSESQFFVLSKSGTDYNIITGLRIK